MLTREQLFEKFPITQPYKDVYVVRPKLHSGDPYQQAAEIVDADWSALGVRHMVIDTITAWATTFRNMSAEDGKFAGTKGNISFGRGTHEFSMSDKGDYQAGQLLAQELTDLAFEQSMHVTFCAHVGIEGKSKSKDSGLITILRAGAATTGSATVGTYGGQFDQYWRLKYKSNQDTERLMVQLRGDSVYGAKHREDGELPPRDIDLPNTLELQRKFWLTRLAEADVVLGEEAQKGYTRAMLYGEIGTGKTRLALSHPALPVLYVAVDANAQYLRSMYRALKVSVEVAA